MLNVESVMPEPSVPHSIVTIEVGDSLEELYIALKPSGQLTLTGWVLHGQKLVLFFALS